MLLHSSRYDLPTRATVLLLHNDQSLSRFNTRAYIDLAATFVLLMMAVLGLRPVVSLLLALFLVRDMDNSDVSETNWH